MQLGAFGIPQEEWPVASSLGLTFSVNGHDVTDLSAGEKRGEYFFDDVEAPLRPLQGDLQAMAQVVRDRGFEPWTSCVPGFAAGQARQVRSWGLQQGIFFGFQNYRYSPYWWSVFDGWLQRTLTGMAMRGRQWWGVVDAVWPVYGPSERYQPMPSRYIRGMIRKYERAGATDLLFYPWRRDVMEAALGHS